MLFVKLGDLLEEVRYADGLTKLTEYFNSIFAFRKVEIYNFLIPQQTTRKRF
jgi:hypothetical protein